MQKNADGSSLPSRRSRESVDPELAAALAMMPKGPNGRLLDLTDIPALQAQLVSASPPPPDDPRVQIASVEVGRDDGSTIELELLRPTGATEPSPALLWFHAGGQVMGAARGDEAYLGRMALELNCVIVAVDYRLAPQTQAPGAAQDGLRAFAYVAEHADELRIDRHRIAVAGASGGGAIATAVGLLTRTDPTLRPVLLALSYPMLDDRNATPSAHEIVDIGIWDRDQNELAWAAVLGDRAGAADLSPICAPGRATELAGMPPTFIAVGELDLFRDEDIDFARRLIEAGTSVELHVYANAFHAFDRFAPSSQITASFEQTWFAYLRRGLHS